jgi:hypothetical protein
LRSSTAAGAGVDLSEDGADGARTTGVAGGVGTAGASGRFLNTSSPGWTTCDCEIALMRVRMI